jgi:hypothetical protein
VTWDEVKPKLKDFVGLTTYKECKIVYDTAIRLNAKSILELGIGQGGFSLSLLYACQETSGKLVSLTIDDYFKQDLLTDKYPALNAVRQYWQPIKTDCLEFAKTWNYSVDLLVIDCDHGMEHTLKELNAYGKYVQTQGEILLHDILHRAHGFDIAKAIIKFLQDPDSAEPIECVWNLNIINTTCGMGRMYRTYTEPKSNEGCSWK